MPEHAVEVREVGRVFTSVKKEEGLRGTLRLLTRPERIRSVALKSVSFTVSPGAFVGLIGSNGAGKTTLLKILSGLIPPTQGEARVLGFVPFERSVEFRRQIALVMGQKAQLWWDLPAQDAFELLRAIYQIPKDQYRKRLNELADLLDVGRLLHTQIRRLSLGERMKMEIIGALIHLPKIIYLDEPTIGLDVLAAHHLREFLKEHNRREGATIILTSHNMDDIERLCPRILILRQGDLLFDGPPSQLVSSNEGRLRIRLLQPTSAAEIAQALEVPASRIETTAPDSHSISGTQTEFPTFLQKLMTRYPVAEMGIEEPSLEQVIHRIYRTQEEGLS